MLANWLGHVLLHPPPCPGKEVPHLICSGLPLKDSEAPHPIPNCIKAGLCLGSAIANQHRGVPSQQGSCQGELQETRCYLLRLLVFRQVATSRHIWVGGWKSLMLLAHAVHVQRHAELVHRQQEQAVAQSAPQIEQCAAALIKHQLYCMHRHMQLGTFTG